MRIAVLIPVFNDWEAVSEVVRRLDGIAAQHHLTIDVVLVDDGSTDDPRVAVSDVAAIETVRILGLRRNVGHQRAIAIGLSYAAASTAADAVVVMDADGQDLPEHVPVLVDHLATDGGRSIVFAARQKRPEGLPFRAAYAAYRWLHLLLVGMSVRVGNFSAIPRRLLERLVTVSDLWNHYAASVFASQLPYRTVPLTRGRRIAGQSKMRVVSLMVHGLSAIAVHSDRVGARLLVAAGAALLLLVVAAAVCASYVGFGPKSAVLWMALLVVLMLLLQVLVAAVAILTSAFQRRSLLGIIPSREYGAFIASDAVVLARRAADRLRSEAGA